MFKKITAIVASAICCMGNVPEARANGWDYCMDAGPTNICAEYRSDNDVVQMQGPAGYIRFGIKCVDHPNHYTWEYKVFEASTNNRYTKSILQGFAESYCEGRLGLTSQAEPKTSLA